MRWEKVFISYSSKDRERVDPIVDALKRVFEPYVAEDEGKGGEELNNKIRVNIEDSNVIVPFLTSESVKSQWVNQEIGYAYRIYRENGEPLILPVKEEGLRISGFVHSNIESIPLLSDYEETAYRLISRLRAYINRNWDTITEIRIKCPNCRNEFKTDLPSARKIVAAVRDKGVIPARCERCQEYIALNPRTFGIVEHQHWAT